MQASTPSALFNERQAGLKVELELLLATHLYIIKSDAACVAGALAHVDLLRNASII